MVCCPSDYTTRGLCPRLRKPDFIPGSTSRTTPSSIRHMLWMLVLLSDKQVFRWSRQKRKRQLRNNGRVKFSASIGRGWSCKLWKWLRRRWPGCYTTAPTATQGQFPRGHFTSETTLIAGSTSSTFSSDD